jgi:ABC-2 type transport system permease protein
MQIADPQAGAAPATTAEIAGAQRTIVGDAPTATTAAATGVAAAAADAARADAASARLGARAAHVGRALKALTLRELTKFVQQRGRLLSALVRPLMWLAVFAAGFYNVFGVSIIPPYKTYITYQVYIVPGLLGIILLFHGMQSSLSMVYDREMGVMRLLLTAPLPRWVLLVCKLLAGTALSVITCYVFLAVCILFDVTFDPIDWLTVLPALIVSGLMLGSLWLFLSVHIKQLENFAGAMNFVMFPMFFFSSALYPLWKLREGGSEILYYVALANPFTHAVELIRFALYGMFEPVAAAVVVVATIVFFLLAAIGYNPQRGMLRRAPQPV